MRIRFSYSQDSLTVMECMLHSRWFPIGELVFPLISSTSLLTKIALLTLSLSYLLIRSFVNAQAYAELKIFNIFVKLFVQRPVSRLFRTSNTRGRSGMSRAGIETPGAYAKENRCGSLQPTYRQIL